MQILDISDSGGIAKLDPDMFEDTDEMVIFGIILVTKVSEKVAHFLDEKNIKRTQSRNRDFCAAIQKHYCENLMPDLLRRHREAALTPMEIKPEIDGIARHIARKLEEMWGASKPNKSVH